jgi:hypothetical protein
MKREFRFQTPIWMTAVVCAIIGIPAGFVQGEDAQRQAEKFFETHVRPLLVEKCQQCHGEEKQRGSLRTDSISSLLTGGESGPALVPHEPDESLLIEAIRYESYEMPPDGQLSEKEIGILVKWVEMGAPWPGGTREVRPTSQDSPISDEDREFWSFRPIQEVPVPQAGGDWPRNDIDRFIFRKLDENGLTPAPEADRIHLVRRLYFDLIGLPPTPEQIDAFLSDSSPDAYEKLVDELLESERYGEHWARFWLDLVRYAESDGFRKDDYRPDAWRYRDYVIDAFNQDKPYDRFVAEQLAGDEIAPHDPHALAATGFLRHGIYEYNQRDARTQWHDMLNDVTDTVGDVFLGMGMGCARCHDHKFDPILQKDYFRLQAFFANIAFRDDVPLATPEEIAEHDRQLQEWEEATREIREKLDALEQPKLQAMEKNAVEKFPEDLQEIYAKPVSERNALEMQLVHLMYLQVLDKQRSLGNSFKGEAKEEWEGLKQQLAEFDDLTPKPLPTGRTVSDYHNETPAIFIPSKQRLGEVEPGFLTIFDPSTADIVPVPDLESTGRRATLAQWLTKPDHPLTTRVIVNRIWKEHFGTGIVATPSDFGHLGEQPSHPELLDWLAREFVAHGWSLKWLHREIVTSATYRQEALRQDEQASRIDPDNRLLWRANVRRLAAEQIRDALLAVTGELQHADGGSAQNAESSKRRSIYTRVQRNKPDALLSVFDFPDRMSSTGDRNTTTSPTQALLLFNNEQLIQRAEAFAKRVTERVGEAGESRIREAFRLAFGRDPGGDELVRLADYLENAPEKTAPLNTISKMPHVGTHALEIGNAPDQLPAQAVDRDLELSGTFTLEAVIVQRSRYSNSSVRTIVSNWSGSNGQPGWSFGVTSDRSSYKPGNLIFQFVGKNAKGKRTYEVIPSDIHLELNRPYRLAATVDLSQTDEAGVRFVVEDLKTGEIRTASVKHEVVAFEPSEQRIVIGGRATSDNHRWDGWIADLRITNQATPVAELTGEEERSQETDLLAGWSFRTETPLGQVTPALEPFADRSSVPTAFVDLCHVLLNSNEFVYID